MKQLFLFLSLSVLVFAGCKQIEEKTNKFEKAAVSNPLPSWADGALKSSIIQFVSEVTKEGGAKYVSPEQRIATFDQDGTLWCEMPVVQMEFVIYRIKEMAPDHPEWKTELPYKAVLEGDNSYLMNDIEHNHGREVMKLVIATHEGMTIETFNEMVKAFYQTVKHPKFHEPFTSTIYQPMLELLSYLRENGFKTYICSGGGNDFMRVAAESMYGILPENVIGSFTMNTFEKVDDKYTIVKTDKDFFFCDAWTKPSGIEMRIGRIPIFVAGNVRSGGDIGQLTYSATNPLPNFQLLVNHDDSIREFAYSEPENESLNAAKAGGWHVVSMKNDWLKIFPFDK
jgi:phosphoglycolate phosphatase-like HAD superfamily hydrolase